MINVLLGIKKNMTSTYDTRGRRVGATALEITPNIVTQLKDNATDGYNAIQLGFGTKKRVKKPQLGIGKKVGSEKGIRWFREVRIMGEQSSSAKASEDEAVKGEVENMKPGQQISVGQVFSIGDEVKVSGISKGRGFAGVVKRHGFHGGPKTHGQSDRHRAPGSIGSGTTPGRVYKGKKMAGHMGNTQFSARGLEVVGIDKQKNLILIKGAVPGSTGGLVRVEKLGRIKGYTPPPEEKVAEENEQLNNTEDQKEEVKEDANS